jgi:hypothetical protein
MEKKICKICKIEQKKSEFHKRKDSKDGLRNECKKCTRVRINEYRKNNTDKINNWNRETYYRNIENHKKTKKKYRENNKETQKILAKKYRENNKEKIKKYYQNNRDKILKKISQRKKERRNNDTMFNLITRIRARFSIFLKSCNITKKNKTFEIIGCSPEFLKEHLEKQFKEGMNWDNRDKWHIDHIIPLSSANTEEEIYKLCHYTNLQPLWAEDNIKKSNKIL